ncbi:hypothetical protein CBR_g16956 [Chara braunii]|uniref:Uncharacterized protein n=1 Tax=Chara braunii TaxID=69332 RepID=A0A388KUJ3_CHABU|nr:hypothetical protein CBR_g16956 [Chara braunii]|eukprot:GBG73613.1 hypothetical protein CBR_g16956 [Chara braunii]
MAFTAAATAVLSALLSVSRPASPFMAITGTGTVDVGITKCRRLRTTTMLRMTTGVHSVHVDDEGASAKTTTMTPRVPSQPSCLHCWNLTPPSVGDSSANIRLLSHQRAGRGFALPWTLDESLLDVEGGIGIRPSWKGTDESRTREELEDQRRSWQRDPCGSRAPPGDVGDVFETRAATLHPYPRDDNDSEGHEDEDEPAGPATAKESGGPHGIPLERQRPTSTGPWSAERERDPESVPSRGAESGIGHRPARVRTCTASSTALPTSTEQLHRQPAGDDRLQRLVRGPRQRLEDRLEGGPSPVQGDDGDRQGLAGGDGGALAGGGGGAEVAVAVEGIPMGGGGGFNDFGDVGMPPGESVGLARGESESRGDISVGMQDLLGQISFADPSSFSPAMRTEVMLGAEGDEDRTPRGETSAERLDRLNSPRAGLMAQRNPRTQELARLAAEDRRRQLGTFTPASVDVAPAAHTDPKGSRHDVAGGGFSKGFEYGSRCSSGDARERVGTDRGATFRAGAASCRPAEARGDIARGRELVPHQAPFLEGHRHRAHGGGPVEERRVGRGACIPPVPTFALSRTRAEIRLVATPRGSLPFGFMTAEELEEHGRTDLTEIDQRIFRSVPKEGKLPHVQDLSWGPASPSLPSGCSVVAPSGGAAGGLPSGGSVAAPSGGAAGGLPSGGSVAAPSGGAADPSSPLTAAPREGGSLSPRSVARRRTDTTERAWTLLDTMLFGRTDRPWSETRRVTTASVGRQPGLRGASTSVRRRDVVASGFGGRGGGGSASGGDGDSRREGAGGAAGSAVDPPLTYGLREASIILREPDVVTRPRQERHVPLDRRQEEETSGTDGLPMARESRRHDDLAAAGIRTVRGRRVIMDDDPGEPPVAPEPSTGRRGAQRQRDKGRGSGRSHRRGSHRFERDPRAHDDC